TELALIKLVRPEVASDPDALAARIGRLERRVEGLASGQLAVAPATAAQGGEPVEPETSPASEPPATAEQPVASPSAEEPSSPPPSGPALSFDRVQEVWPGLFGGLRDVLGSRRWALFREVTPGRV